VLPVAEGHAEGDRHQGTLKFEIVVPHDQADRVMLYEVYASPEAFETHWHGPAKQEANRDLEPLRVSVSFVRCDLVETLQSTASFISDVIFGHKADVPLASTNVRCWRNSRHALEMWPPPLLTQSGRRRSKVTFKYDHLVGDGRRYRNRKRDC
jgi:quinol monooxygenase YgiN